MRPSAAEIDAVAAEFGLHGLVVEDTIKAHQRPKLERYGEVEFVVLRPARYVDPVEVVEIGEVHVFLGPDFVITVRHAQEPDLAEVRHRLEAEPQLLDNGPLRGALRGDGQDRRRLRAGARGAAGRHRRDRGAGLRRRSERLETDLHPQPGGDRVPTGRRAAEDLFVSLREQLKQRASESDLELRRALRDVADHATRVLERTRGFRELLANILTVNAALVVQRQNDEITRLTEAGYEQNEQVKRISSWAAILFAPTLVASVYGMNFDHMPELGWELGYPFAVLLMLLLGGGLYAIFKRRGWL